VSCYEPRFVGHQFANLPSIVTAQRFRVAQPKAMSAKSKNPPAC
jgi:hypothetical protein